jgi:uncharacterized protein (TIGR03083 family)
VDPERSWLVVEQERRYLADLLESLDDQDWDRPSLCAGWRVRDVAAHVALAPQHPGTGAMLIEAVRALGRFNKLNHDIAVRHASHPGTDLVAELRAHAGSRRLPVVTNLDNILFDTLVHVQDVAIPLGRQHAMPVDAAVYGADRVWRMGWPFHAKRRLAGSRLVATDVEWRVGDGPEEIRGPIEALLLLLTGRTATGDRLERVRR